MYALNHVSCNDIDVEHRLQVSSSVQTSQWAGAKGRIIISVIRKCSGGRLPLYGSAHASLRTLECRSAWKGDCAFLYRNEPEDKQAGRRKFVRRPFACRGPCARNLKTCRCCTGGLLEAKSTMHATAWPARRTQCTSDWVLASASRVLEICAAG